MSRVEPNRNVYVGHRYVPLILEEWDKKNSYEGLSVVTHKGNSYTSKKRVPSGIDILNKEFWSMTGNYNAQIEYYREETERVSNALEGKADIEEMNDFKTGVNNDITLFKKDVNGEITAFKTDVNGEITAFKTDVNGEITAFKSDVNGEISEFKSLVESNISDVKKDITDISKSLKTSQDKEIYIEDLRENNESDQALLEKAFNLMIGDNFNDYKVLRLKADHVYELTHPIEYFEHKYDSIIGDGSIIKVSDTVSIYTRLPYMFDISRSGSLYSGGWVKFNGVTFDANNRTNSVFKGYTDSSPYGITYTQFFQCRFINLAKGSWALDGVSYQVVINQCAFRGYGEDPQNDNTHWCGKGIRLMPASNGVFVTESNFSRMEKVSSGECQKVVFRDNVFDYMKESAFHLWGNSVSIVDNYFEGCGGTIETINTFGGNEHDIDSVIIYHGYPTAWESMGTGLKVDGNTFADTKSKELFAFAHFRNITVVNNIVTYQRTKINSIYKLFGKGSGHSVIDFLGGLLSDNNSFSLLGIDGINNYFSAEKMIDESELTDKPNGLKNIVIHDVRRQEQKTVSKNLKPKTLELELTPYEFSLTDYKGLEVQSLKRVDGASYTHKFDLSGHLVNIHDSILNFTGNIAQSDTSKRLYLDVNIDGEITSFRLEHSDFSTGFKSYNHAVYIPDNATSLEITLRSTADIGTVYYFKDFDIIPSIHFI